MDQLLTLDPLSPNLGRGKNEKIETRYLGFPEFGAGRHKNRPLYQFGKTSDMGTNRSRDFGKKHRT